MPLSKEISMKRRHAVLISLAVAATTVAGALAASKTMVLSAKTTKPKPVASTVIVKHRRALDRWEASLRKALAKKPPKLPRIPHYPRVYIPSVPASWSFASAPQPVAVRLPAGERRASRPAAPRPQAVKHAPKQEVKPVIVPKPTAAPAPAVAAAPAPAPAPEPAPQPLAPTTTEPSAPPTDGGAAGGHEGEDPGGNAGGGEHDGGHDGGGEGGGDD
jgi:hypothetical protein